MRANKKILNILKTRGYTYENPKMHGKTFDQANYVLFDAKYDLTLSPLKAELENSNKMYKNTKKS